MRRSPWLLACAVLLSCDGTEPIVGHIEGIVAIEGEPVSASVSLVSDTVLTRFTDATGRFSFQVGDGAYTVSIDGIPSEATFDATSQTAQVTAQGQVVPVDFLGEWIRTSVIAGTVLANDAPAPDIGVAIAGPSEAMARTDAEGRFRIEGLRAGTYQVSLTDFATERYEFPGTTFSTVAGVGELAELAFEATLLPPARPAGLGADQDGPYRIVLSWQDESSYETEYRITRRIEAGEWSDLEALEPDAEGFVDEELTPGTLYAYQVRACNEIGCSEGVVEAEARTEQIPPAPPSDFTGEALGAFEVGLSWVDDSFNEQGFHLERRTGADGEWGEIAVEGPGATAYRDGGLESETVYGYRIRSCNEVGCSDYMGPLSLTTPEAPPASPAGLSASSQGSSQIDLAWQDQSDNEDGFRVERRLEGASWTTIVETGSNATAYSNVGLAPATLYTYRVLACNTGGCSAASNEASATTEQAPPPAPSGLQATATAPDRVELSWVYDGTNETGIHLERRIKNQGSFAEVATLPPGTAGYADQGVETGRTFQYRVRACNGVGCSGYSPTAEATTVAVPENNLEVSAVHLTQVVQTLGGGVPLVQGRSGLLRVFVTTGLANAFQPDVRIRLYDGGTMIQENVVSAPSSSVPLEVNEGSLSASWNLSVPSSLIKPGLGVEIDVDPGNAVSETNESDNRYPASGTHAFDVRDTDPLSVVFVPVHQSVNGLEGSANPGSYTSVAQSLFPVPFVGGSARGTYVTDAPELQPDNDNGAWGMILNEMLALRAADGSSSHYYGAVKVSYGGGIAGIGYVGAPAAVGWDKGGSAGVAAHEWGHNLGRRHAPCGGAGGPDPSYPYAGGSIGVWGYNGTALRSPNVYKDLMGYCGPDWISDYHYNAIMSAVQASPTPPAAALAGPEDGLLVWGRVDQHGVVLEPAFQVRAPARLPEESGPYRIRALDPTGSGIFDLSFAGAELPEEAGPGRHFAFVVPVSMLGGRTLASLRLDAAGVTVGRDAPPALAPGAAAPDAAAQLLAGGEVEITWDGDRYPMAMVRNPDTGEIISFARGGSVRMPGMGSTVEVVLSDGVASRSQAVVVVR